MDMASARREGTCNPHNRCVPAHRAHRAVGHAIGPEWLRELIVASPSAGLLLPLTTALEGELGIESRVAREVEEVAEDIRQDFTKMERSWTGASLEK